MNSVIWNSFVFTTNLMNLRFYLFGRVSKRLEIGGIGFVVAITVKLQNWVDEVYYKEDTAQPSLAPYVPQGPMGTSLTGWLCDWKETRIKKAKVIIDIYNVAMSLKNKK